MSCVVTDPDCEHCRTAPRELDPDHECHELCHIFARTSRDPDNHWKLLHAPIRHRCGYILDDRRGHNYRAAPVQCPFGACTQFFCPGCRRYDMGWGAIQCPCDTGRCGHGTYAEFPRPRIRHLTKRSRKR